MYYVHMRAYIVNVLLAPSTKHSLQALVLQKGKTRVLVTDVITYQMTWDPGTISCISFRRTLHAAPLFLVLLVCKALILLP